MDGAVQENVGAVLLLPVVVGARFWAKLSRTALTEAVRLAVVLSE